MQYFGNGHDMTLDEVMKELSFFDGNLYYTDAHCQPKSNDKFLCPSENLTFFINEVRSSCEEIFDTCLWREQYFNCCKHFHLQRTELGPCFTLSSRTEMESDPEYLNLYSNSKTSLGDLLFAISTQAEIYIHSPYDIPHINTLATDKLETIPRGLVRVGITVKDIMNDPEVYHMSIKQRNCRFPDESNLKISNKYSYSRCVTDCRAREQLERCNCTHPWIPNYEPHCGLAGMLCLSRHSKNLTVLRRPGGLKSVGLKCFCDVACEQSEIKIIHMEKFTFRKELLYQNVHIELSKLPSEAYKRYAVRGRFDLVVSMGGAGGLFVGASLLTFTEIAFFIIFRLPAILREKTSAQHN